MFAVFYALIWLVSWLPLPILYILSDIIYLIVYRLVGYRKPIVKRNLSNSFPEKSAKELLQIERRFYHFFCDLFVETIYEMHISESEILRRIDFGNIDIFLEQYAKGKSIMLMTAHYGNWEWLSAISLLLPQEKHLSGIYKKLNNCSFDKFLQELRAVHKGDSIETHDLMRKMITLRKEEKIRTFAMVADQSPWIKNLKHRIEFLNQDTPVLDGTEQLAKKFNYPVLYVQINRVKRGYYKCEYYPITLEPNQTSELEITKKYFQILEDKIKAAPEYWLWTHNRWKHSKTKQTDY